MNKKYIVVIGVLCAAAILVILAFSMNIFENDNHNNVDLQFMPETPYKWHQAQGCNGMEYRFTLHNAGDATAEDIVATVIWQDSESSLADPPIEFSTSYLYPDQTVNGTFCMNLDYTAGADRARYVEMEIRIFWTNRETGEDEYESFFDNVFLETIP